MFDPEKCDFVSTEAFRKQQAGNPVAEVSRMASAMFVSMAMEGKIDTRTMAENSSAFAVWSYPVVYAEGVIVRDPDDGKLYKVNAGQGHTSQEGWEPHNVPALWSVISDPAEEWPEWRQPLGAHDAWHLGDKCSHNGSHWICDKADAAGNNVWEPGVYGWSKVEDAGEPEPEPGEPDEPGPVPSDVPAWEDVGTGYLFKAGTQFTYGGTLYDVLRDLTKTPGWEPPALLGDFYKEAEA